MITVAFRLVVTKMRFLEGFCGIENQNISYVKGGITATFIDGQDHTMKVMFFHFISHKLNFTLRIVMFGPVSANLF